jgi:hypothetical protein
MPTKLKANGTAVATMTAEKLHEVHAGGGKQGHKARMELIKRKLIDANYTATV